MSTLLNRMAIVLRPKQPYADWANGLDDDGPRFNLEEHRKSPACYLVDEEVAPDEHEAIVKFYSEHLFEEWLAGWMTDEAVWPKDRSWKVFLEWFDWEVLEPVFDVSDSPLEEGE